jgi:periplasmic divalent cation tolerance protein
MSVVMVYVTASDPAEAEKLGRAAVEARLAACANVLGATTAIYWWEGKVESGPEAALVLKTREDLVPALTDKINALHSYDCPCVVAVPIVDGNRAFMQWLEDETAPAPD